MSRDVAASPAASHAFAMFQDFARRRSTCMVCLPRCSVRWERAYGDRARRDVVLEAGHAAQNVLPQS